ncbi:MAG: MarR family transcriptional regulator [Chloroflexota bacterium]
MDRPVVLAQLLEELTSHTPAGVMRYLRHWSSGPLSLIHLNVLTVLESDGPTAMSGLADALDVSQASATGIVDRMRKRDLVRRERDPDDRRVVRVVLTETGRRLIDGVAAERRGRLEVLLQDLSDAELEGFLLGARALRRAREAHFQASAERGPSPADGR